MEGSIQCEGKACIHILQKLIGEKPIDTNNPFSKTARNYMEESLEFLSYYLDSYGCSLNRKWAVKRIDVHLKQIGEYLDKEINDSESSKRLREVRYVIV